MKSLPFESLMNLGNRLPIEPLSDNNGNFVLIMKPESLFSIITGTLDFLYTIENMFWLHIEFPKPLTWQITRVIHLSDLVMSVIVINYIHCTF